MPSRNPTFYYRNKHLFEKERASYYQHKAMDVISGACRLFRLLPPPVPSCYLLFAVRAECCPEFARGVFSIAIPQLANFRQYAFWGCEKGRLAFTERSMETGKTQESAE